ncbi:MAG TPA: response regulator [Candidatus Nanoarchaeia archaeon]|nr:response regulator [Candidatus Nanoarchaeia archaeon]
MKSIILMVEDDEETGLSRKDLLEKRRYFVALYDDGRAAAEAIQEELSYHVGLFDLSLPEVGGDELIRLSKRINPNIPVICISAHPYPDQMAPGANRYLVRPVDTDRIDQVITKLLQEEKGKIIEV